MQKITAGRDQLGSLPVVTNSGHWPPTFAELNDDVLFGQVWARTQQLSPRDRSLATISALLGAGETGMPLQSHFRMALGNGLTLEEITEVITHVAFYAGWPRAWNAFNQLKAVLEEDGKASQEEAQGAH